MLGTLVDVTLTAADTRSAQQAFDAAFGEVERIQQLMSAHHPASEVSRLSEQAHLRPMRVHPDTLAVLRLALALHAESGGIFDVATGDVMAGAGRVPALARARGEERGTSADILIDADGQVRFARALHLDLGGVAKGYAMDCAARSLQAHGINSALLNAGGDMLAIGQENHTVHLRFASGVKAVAVLRKGAFAASCHAGALSPGAHVDARDARTLQRRDTIAVQAPTAAEADALTKVAMVCGATADRLCAMRRAQWRAFDYFAA